VRNAVRDQGVVPVMRTIARLFNDARHNFLFMLSPKIVQLDENYENQTDLFEIDISWIADGKFGLAEVKNSVNLFNSAAQEKLLAVARSVRPDIILIAATNGDENKFQKITERIAADLTATGMIVTAWGPKKFREIMWGSIF